MQIRGLAIGALTLAILGGAAWWSQHAEEQKQASTTGTPDAPRLSSFKEADIDRIVVRHLGSLATVVQRNSPTDWSLTAPQAFHADTDTAAAMATTFGGLTWDRLVEEKPADLGPFGLTSPSLEVVASNKAGKSQRLLIGDEVPTGGSFFAKLDGDPRVFVVANGTKAALDKTEKDLRDKRLLSFDTEKLNSFHYAAVEFTKAEGDWRITKPTRYRADTFQVEELLRKLKDAKLDPAISEEDAKKADASFQTGSPLATVEVNSQTLQVRKKGTDFFARSSLTPGTHKLSADVGEAFTKTIEDFRSKKIFDFAFTEPNKVEIKDGDKQYSFTKSAEKWLSKGKTLDAVSIQSLIDRLRDLSAAKFASSGFAAPAVTITVESNSGKRSETVELTKTASAYIAKRASEPNLYELDTKAVNDLLRAAADVR